MCPTFVYALYHFAGPRVIKVHNTHVTLEHSYLSKICLMLDALPIHLVDHLWYCGDIWNTLWYCRSRCIKPVAWPQCSGMSPVLRSADHIALLGVVAASCGPGMCTCPQPPQTNLDTPSMVFWARCHNNTGVRKRDGPRWEPEEGEKKPH